MSASLHSHSEGHFSIRGRLHGIPFVITGWLLALSFPPLLIDLVRNPEQGMPYQLAAFCLAAPLVAISNWRKVRQVIPLWYTSPKILLLTGALGLALANSLIMGIGKIIFDVLTLVTIFTIFGSLWLDDEMSIKRIAFYSAIGLFGFIAFGFATQPLELERRHVGFIHPNLFGATAMAAAILFCLSGARLQAVAMTVAAAVMVIVSSRSSLVAFAVFVGVLSFYYSVQSRNTFLRCLVVLAVGVMALFSYKENVINFMNRTLLLDDLDRGLQSGLSGRAEAWENFFPQFSEHALLGVGFRQRDAYDGTHNAVLNIFIENGVLGGSFLLGFVFIVIISAANTAFLHNSAPQRSRDLAAVVLAALCAFVVRALPEPQIFNMGDAPSLTFLFVLAYVCVGEHRMLKRSLAKPVGLTHKPHKSAGDNGR